MREERASSKSKSKSSEKDSINLPSSPSSAQVLHNEAAPKSEIEQLIRFDSRAALPTEARADASQPISQCGEDMHTNILHLDDPSSIGLNLRSASSGFWRVGEAWFIVFRNFGV